MAEAAQNIEWDEEPDVSHLITEDDTPVDNIFSEMQMRLLVESLYRSWRDEQGNPFDFLALSDVGIFSTNQNPAIVPDVMVSVGVKPPPDIWEKKNRSYYIWRYGKPPDLVVEIVSNRVGGELTSKFTDYARIGVAYYLVFDPDRQLGDRILRLFERHAATYVEVLDPTWMPGLNLGVALWVGDYDGLDATWLRWRSSDGTLLATGQEKSEKAEAKAAEAEAKAAEAEAKAAEAEAKAAQAEAKAAQAEAKVAEAQQREAILAAHLRKLGIDPKSLES